MVKLQTMQIASQGPAEVATAARKGVRWHINCDIDGDCESATATHA